MLGAEWGMNLWKTTDCFLRGPPSTSLEWELRKGRGHLIALVLERLSLVPFDSIPGKFLTFKMAFLQPITFLKKVIDFRCCQSPVLSMILQVFSSPSGVTDQERLKLLWPVRALEINVQRQPVLSMAQWSFCFLWNVSFYMVNHGSWEGNKMVCPLPCFLHAC